MSRRRRNAKQIQRLLEQYQASGMTQRMFCRQTGVGLSTLSRYLQRQGGRSPRWIPVRVETAAGEADPGFVLVLGKGRRIESSWRFQEAELARLIRVVEGV